MICRRRQGFTLIELVVAIIIISTLAAVLLDRMLYYQEAAEKAALEQLVNTLRSALRLQIAERLLNRQGADIAALAGDNPINWLDAPPANYLGERFDPAPHEIAKGSWYFDLKDRHLVYVMTRGAHFTPNPRGRKHVRYITRVETSAKTPQERPILSDKFVINGVILAPAEPYQWF